MCIISYWWSQARFSSRRSCPSVISSSVILPRGDGQDSAANHDDTFTVRKSKSDQTLRPVLLDDGSHPYFPGTPWNELELAGTIDARHQPRPRRLKLRFFAMLK
ncbi:hypothetical protein MJO28_013324 [Puccinia striiformis f. sp. tritici]|uniref:Uncharacterized protein n=4 Tax=Puccinia striiformis TaxID=27350 RepID=A0A0L0VZZ9_9BASI|nr:hypothetical protein MJO28_013324 [Puccinia striiformis f. sp. tritici]KNF03989.1 hypothetical protein PSTG_02699 [Puccinia striiformis f. sp. tritici PST-78]POV96089.1 hypothetical protein PSHT_15320 [Puccinia striiformis]KAI7942922.1 hypothetical protein MJO29_012766 [Puccinia striiformis f. sp. tritici]KNF04585.1 hypothetical protein PSTG_02496 [Puccinia striiformis f. sp. tritici PST-78]